MVNCDRLTVARQSASSWLKFKERIVLAPQEGEEEQPDAEAAKVC